jgi:hypothetical protein
VPRGKGRICTLSRARTARFSHQKGAGLRRIPAGDIKVITGITPDQHILGAPLSSNFSGVRLGSIPKGQLR